MNLAISEMDKVVQQNAANAEESAAASEAMNAQAEQLREYVQELVTVVAGEKETHQASKRTISIKRFKKESGKISHPDNKPISHGKQEVRPDQVIPFDADDDFKDFDGLQKK